MQGEITEQGASIAALTATVKVLQATVTNLVCICQTKYQSNEYSRTMKKNNKDRGTCPAKKRNWSMYKCTMSSSLGCGTFPAGSL